MGGMRELLAMRERAKCGRDPTCSDDTLAYLLSTANAIRPRRILEIGAGEGLTSVALLLHTQAEVTGVEINSLRAARARGNAALFGVGERFHLIEGDAAECLPALKGPFDMIFLDGPKVQYRRYYADCKRLLRRRGVLISDDVMLFHWAKNEIPPKRTMLIRHLCEYLDMIAQDPDVWTEILSIGDGVAFTVKR